MGTVDKKTVTRQWPTGAELSPGRPAVRCMFIRASARMNMRSFSNIHSGSRLVVRSFGSASLNGAALHRLV